MPNTTTTIDDDLDLRQITQDAATWPTVAEIAADYNVSQLVVRREINRRNVEALRLDVIRVNPESWESFLRSRYTRPSTSTSTT